MLPEVVAPEAYQDAVLRDGAMLVSASKVFNHETPPLSGGCANGLKVYLPFGCFR